MASGEKLRRYGCLDEDLDFNPSLDAFLGGIGNDPVSGRYYHRNVLKPLPWNFYGSLAEKHGEMLKTLLGSSKSEQGVNVLFYGAPGTGKTSFAHSLATELGLTCYDIVRNVQGNGEASGYTPARRFGALEVCDAQVEPAKSLLVVDEADEMLRGFSRTNRIAGFGGGGVLVVDCSEPLVAVRESPRLRIRGASGHAVQLREGVARRLYAVAELLPTGFNLILVEGYRSVARQQMLWNVELAAVKALYPSIDRPKAERLTRLRVANPAFGGGGYQTGGAVDVTLADADWCELDMGTEVCAFSERALTHSRAVSWGVRKRRRLLCRAMRLAGFVNYLGEWWHFSYGDKLWAAYGRKPSASIGPLVGRE